MCEVYALYIVRNKATIRQTADEFGACKSTVHDNVTRYLRYRNRGLYEEVQEVLQKNKAERHIRGGEATKKLWTKEHS